MKHFITGRCRLYDNEIMVRGIDDNFDFAFAYIKAMKGTSRRAMYEAMRLDDSIAVVVSFNADYIENYADYTDYGTVKDVIVGHVNENRL